MRLTVVNRLSKEGRPLAGEHCQELFACLRDATGESAGASTSSSKIFQRSDFPSPIETLVHPPDRQVKNAQSIELVGIERGVF